MNPFDVLERFWKMGFAFGLIRRGRVGRGGVRLGTARSGMARGLRANYTDEIVGHGMA